MSTSTVSNRLLANTGDLLHSCLCHETDSLLIATLVLCASTGDQDAGSQAAGHLHPWHPGSEEPAVGEGEENPASGGRTLHFHHDGRRLACQMCLRPLADSWWPVCAVQHDYEKTRARLDKEEKLIISAWYNMVSGTRWPPLPAVCEILVNIQERGGALRGGKGLHPSDCYSAPIQISLACMRPIITFQSFMDTSHDVLHDITHTKI